MTPETLLALNLFLLPLAYTPGPGTVFFTAFGARFGLAAMMPALAGYLLVTAGATFVIGAGFALAQGLPGALPAVRIAGAFYLLYLAAGLVRAPARALGGESDARAPRRVGFVDGALVMLLNAKGYLIIVLIFARFVAEQPSQLLHAALVSAVFTLNVTLSLLLWTLVGVRLGRLLARPGWARFQGWLFGGALAAVAIWLALP